MAALVGHSSQADLRMVAAALPHALFCTSRPLKAVRNERGRVGARQFALAKSETFISLFLRLKPSALSSAAAERL